uniref:Uncharacterized protein n=1 Tax=Syphacia muris TaxID=451379 RepID=A0A158R3Y4_9BILA
MTINPPPSPPQTPPDFGNRFPTHRLSTTAEEENSGSASSPKISPKPSHKLGICESSAPNFSGPNSKPPVTVQRRGFKGAHASFRLRMFQEQHGFEPKINATSSMPGSPPEHQKLPAKLERTLLTSSLRRRLDTEGSHQQKLSHLPAELTEKLRKLINRSTTHSHSHSEHLAAEGNANPSVTPKASTDNTSENRSGESTSSLQNPKFRQAHQSFRIRMLQEQYGGFEPVFISKKRTPRQQASEFKGGDLNKYTARTYTIQNGNEIFGGCLLA